ncbi:hypothetical protein HFU84_14175 [Acidithiobacillus sp. CV18-2]|uniref:Uncharacterized protein n=1 Tax=Igneacidithiobacillus copahuensis TaxID=2724909 RepID=A0AAE2YMR2_9PROT|nr:hypothetical protein [Igneacidithiobacillus copahuensis]MBU2753946.1 hypothetical protein [Acidithiobacillus sp. CV18-3]MBU2756174.1 hypothetical protein [Acidithiobacillus sp. BN09-2]MBU2778619.1 hypothetical protein [Acidithiobacillus sp. CV18-2]MBU2797186.1 hypothetical protein [Acidithiobacillus sp. VAN18-2]MBU2798925.1 hypothetical protein [Acidithiobacillus sp. VAN18-4]UTV81466.1 hypothetical protein MQE22_02285 [Acidithiobacillus sp. YTS05]
MAFDEAEVTIWVQPSAAQVQEWREHWLAVMDLALWGELKSSKIGALGKLRRRILECGEKLRSYSADRSWIPHPRERIKNCLSSGLQLRESLDKVAELLQEMEAGAALVPLRGLWDNLAENLLADLQKREERLVALLNTQYGEEIE